MYYPRIRELRKEKNLTQKYMAEFLQINQRTYSRYETGEIDISTVALCKLAKFHGVSTDYILNLTDFRMKPPGSKK